MKIMGFWKGLLLAGLASAAVVVKKDAATDSSLAKCPGYTASNVKTTDSGVTANLKLAGAACNVYGTDLKELTLQVTYETSK